MKKKITKALATIMGCLMAITPMASSVGAKTFGIVSRSITWSDWLNTRNRLFVRKGMDSWFIKSKNGDLPVSFVYSAADLNGLRGDVNGDGCINAADIALLTRIILEDEYDEYDTSYAWNNYFYAYTTSAYDADLTKDGSVDVCDLALLKQIILGTAHNPAPVSPESGAVPVFYFYE